jgi:hypothetical protein
MKIFALNFRPKEKIVFLNLLTFGSDISIINNDYYCNKEFAAD